MQPTTPRKRSKKSTAQHDAVQQLLRPNQSVALLQELHILTRDGTLNQDSRRKLKQVYHLYGFIEPLLQQLQTDNAQITLADHGAGKSYLGFIVYDLFFKQQDAGTIYGIETRSELVDRSIALAQQLGFERMQFLATSSQQSTQLDSLPQTIDIVTALHACDTATDEAIAFALHKQAKHMVLIPCCQAEAAAHLRKNKAASLAATELAELWRHPLHTREFGSHLTNVLRCLYLEAQGYRVTVTELVGWEHSLKNELILASYTGHKKHSAAKRMQAIAQAYHVEDWVQMRFPKHRKTA